MATGSIEQLRAEVANVVALYREGKITAEEAVESTQAIIRKCSNFDIAYVLFWTQQGML